MTRTLLPKDWHARIAPIKGRLYIEFKDANAGGKWRQRATGLLDAPENEPEARALAEEVERRMKALERVRAATAASPTVRAFFERWIKDRDGTSAVDDAQRLKDYVLPVLGDRQLGEVTAPMLKSLMKSLKERESRKGGVLAPRTVRNTYGALQAMFGDALNEGLIPYTPCTLRGRDLPAKRDKDSTFRDEAIFTLPEVLLIVGSELVPWDRRVFYALMFFGCARFGEASEARWKDYEAGLSPRPKLKVLRSYNTRHKLVKGTKAERPRHVPCVSLLAKMLAEWKLTGWNEFAPVKRIPRPDDLIVPSRLGKNRSANHMLKKFHQDLIRLGLTKVDDEGEVAGRQRRQHDARRTWFSRVMAEGANETHARWTAWGPPHDLWADYTSMPWDTLCAVVDGLDGAIKRAQRGAKARAR